MDDKPKVAASRPVGAKVPAETGKTAPAPEKKAAKADGAAFQTAIGAGSRKGGPLQPATGGASGGGTSARRDASPPPASRSAAPPPGAATIAARPGAPGPAIHRGAVSAGTSDAAALSEVRLASASPGSDRPGVSGAAARGAVGQSSPVPPVGGPPAPSEDGRGFLGTISSIAKTGFEKVRSILGANTPPPDTDGGNLAGAARNPDELGPGNPGRAPAGQSIDLADQQRPTEPLPPGFKGPQTKLSDTDLPRIGHTVGVGEDEIHAFLDVETSGSGFDKKGRPKMLFEPHIFYRELPAEKRQQAVDAGLAYESYGDKPYPTDSYRRLERAMKIDETAALKSASWGVGQVLGTNYEDAGYTSVHAMVNDFVRGGEPAQLQGAIDFVGANGLGDELREHDWRGFARGYNGSSYARNGYHTKLRHAHAEWDGIRDTPWAPPQTIPYQPRAAETEAPSAADRA